MATGIVYLDSSVALRTILDVPQRPRLQAWVDALSGPLVSSRLLRTEMVRVLRREGRPLDQADALLTRTGLLDITRETHTVAESIGPHVRTLDAMHLATALLVGEPVTVATHDTSMMSVARDLGLAVTDPVADLS
ncbi:PIN domain-containing protein [Knoellia remsis]|uniref:Ribonuclease VapC n=1 Tax=Knoellia remsis TaxID=407159 RepID=A0A2T0UFE6_9MICO|nr:type II toxin-antitoxin system VapC family toxin [Knoellia remsis]PRY56660.1 PIN domain-containing protein [Knoellia remsis]